jgi:hypothetical protein
MGNSSREEFREHVHVVLHVLGQRVEEEVQLLEVGPLHVPMGELGLRVEVRGIREAFVEEAFELLALGAGKVDACGELVGSAVAGGGSTVLRARG